MNAQQVAESFARGEIGSGPNIMSTGDKVYSYQMLIARRVRGGKVRIVRRGPTATTRKHIGIVLRAVGEATLVDEL